MCSYVHGTLGSPDSDTTRPMKSPAEHNETLAEEVEGDSKDELRRAVESLFNTLYGMMYQLIYYICMYLTRSVKNEPYKICLTI